MGLLDELKGFLAGRSPLAQDRSGGGADLEIQAATAILLLEAAYGDESYAWREHRTIVKALEREFGLGPKQTRDLLARAEEIRPPVVKLVDVTDVIRDRFDRQQRQEILRLVQRVIESDGDVAEWEAAFADHVARAVGLSGEDARAARHADERP